MFFDLEVSNQNAREPFLTLAGKVTNKLSTRILLKMAERSEAKSAKQSFASKIKI